MIHVLPCFWIGCNLSLSARIAMRARNPHDYLFDSRLGHPLIPSKSAPSVLLCIHRLLVAAGDTSQPVTGRDTPRTYGTFKEAFCYILITSLRRHNWE
jgi:hypothetical protein